jgi:hypothetical protein
VGFTGKDPFAAALSALEFVGPCRPDPEAKWIDRPDGRCHPRGTENPTAWVQIAAVSKDQTRNTMTLFPGLFSPECKAEHGIDLGKEIIYSYQGARRIEAVTSSPRALEGGRPSFVVKNETHHWISSNEGHAMADVIERNATKSSGGMARTLAITNAYDPAEDSVAQRDREAWEDADAGESLTTGILYDSLEAPEGVTLEPEGLADIIDIVRGDSTWLDIPRIVASILDTRNAPSRSRRFFLNQVVAAEDAWTDPTQIDACADSSLGIGTDLLALDKVPGRWFVFFDGSKSDDATGLVGCRLHDGHVVTLGMWAKPPKGRGQDDWTAPRPLIDARVERVFEVMDVVGFWCDPSHTRDDETQERYWDALVDEWHRRYRGRLKLWAKPGKATGHSTRWDMSNEQHTAAFTVAAEQAEEDIREGALTHDGDARLRIHTHNARRYVNRYGTSVWKGHRESQRKIDLAVCMIGARMMRRQFMNAPVEEDKPRSGRVW